jgi:hypothetical protein
MSSTLLVRDALSRVSDQLGDSNPQFSRWTQHTLVNYLNDAQRVLAKYLPHSCSRVDAIKLSPGTRQSLALVPAANIIPGDGSTAADSYGMRLLGMPRNMGSNGTTPGRVIRPVDRRTLDMADPGWHAKTGLYVTGFSYDLQTPKFVYVTPGVPASGLWVEVSWIPLPHEIPAGSTGQEYAATNSDSTKVSVDDLYFDDLVNYMMARAHMRDAEFAGAQQLAAYYASAFMNSINAQAVAAGLPNPKLRSLPVPTTDGQ